MKSTQYLLDSIQRNSVPRRPDMSKDEIRAYIQQLMSEAEEWKAIKMIVLGHGRIGKTTLLHSIHQIIDPSIIQVYFHLLYLCCQTVVKWPPAKREWMNCAIQKRGIITLPCHSFSFLLRYANPLKSLSMLKHWMCLQLYRKKLSQGIHFEYRFGLT